MSKNSPTGSNAEKPGPQLSTIVLSMVTVGTLLAGVIGFMLFVSHRKQLEQETRIEALETAVARLSRGGRAAVMRDPDPTVILINEKLGLYATSIGLAHGAEPGDRVRVLRGGKPIAELLLDSVEPTASAGKPVGNRPLVQIRKGDRVELIKR